MSLATGRTIKHEMEHALRTAGLPDDINKIVGGKFLFGCDIGSHHHILAGSITAVEFSDEGGLKLYVSCPKMRGIPIHCIRHTANGWAVYLDLSPDKIPERPAGSVVVQGCLYAANVFHGELNLL